MIIYDENLDGTFGVAAQEQVVTCGRKLTNAALVPSANRVAVSCSGRQCKLNLRSSRAHDDDFVSN